MQAKPAAPTRSDPTSPSPAPKAGGAAGPSRLPAGGAAGPSRLPAGAAGTSRLPGGAAQSTNSPKVAVPGGAAGSSQLPAGSKGAPKTAAASVGSSTAASGISPTGGCILGGGGGARPTGEVDPEEIRRRRLGRTQFQNNVLRHPCCGAALF